STAAVVASSAALAVGSSTAAAVGAGSSTAVAVGSAPSGSVSGPVAPAALGLPSPVASVDISLLLRGAGQLGRTRPLHNKLPRLAQRHTSLKCPDYLPVILKISGGPAFCPKPPVAWGDAADGVLGADARAVR